MKAVSLVVILGLTAAVPVDETPWIKFLGDRQQGGPKIFGDDELFVIPLRGPATWFRPGLAFEQIEWVK
jgi:hypothetical protein